MMRIIAMTLMLSLWDRLDAAPADLIPEQNVFMKEINWMQPNNINQKFNPNVILSTPKTIIRTGYPAESHTVTTEDGYILTLHRIPGGKDSLPVLLLHGLITNSADFIVLGKGKALAYLLADQGYDVWLANSRGSLYSKAHISLSTSNSTFWDFSIHEIGIYDVPAMIKFITNMRSQPLHTFIGYSMGTTCFYIMASERPEMVRMVRKMISFGAAVFIDHMRSPLRYFAPFWKQLEIINDDLLHGVLLNNNLYKLITKFVNQNSMMQELFVNMVFSIAGYDYEQFNYTLIPFILGHDPIGGSAKSAIHYAQILHSGKFRQYDYGRAKNLLKYHSAEPPEYKLANIKIPIALFYGKNDWLTDPADVKKLYNLLPNVIDLYEVPWPYFNHLDFIWAKDAAKLVYKRVIEIIRDSK